MFSWLEHNDLIGHIFIEISTLDLFFKKNLHQKKQAYIYYTKFTQSSKSPWKNIYLSN
jgi:hypothetical protein